MLQIQQSSIQKTQANKKCFDRIHKVSLCFHMMVIGICLWSLFSNFFLRLKHFQFWSYVCPIVFMSVSLIRVGIILSMFWCYKQMGCSKELQIYDVYILRFYKERQGQLTAYKILVFLLIYLACSPIIINTLLQNQQYGILTIFIIILLANYILDFQFQSYSKDYWKGVPSVYNYSILIISKTQKLAYWIYSALSFYLIILSITIVILIAISKHHIFKGFTSIFLSCCISFILIPSIVLRLAINMLMLSTKNSQITLKQRRSKFINQLLKQSSYYNITWCFLKATPIIYRLTIFFLIFISLIIADNVQDCQLGYLICILLLAILYQPLQNFLLQLKIQPFNKKFGVIGQVCPICLQAIKQQQQIIELVCSHFFHCTCGNLALKSSFRCPICRAEFQL